MSSQVTIIKSAFIKSNKKIPYLDNDLSLRLSLETFIKPFRFKMRFIFKMRKHTQYTHKTDSPESLFR